MSHPEVQPMSKGVVDQQGQYFHDFTANRQGYKLKFMLFNLPSSWCFR